MNIVEKLFQSYQIVKANSYKNIISMNGEVSSFQFSEQPFNPDEV